jgi:hypothetical protein
VAASAKSSIDKRVSNMNKLSLCWSATAVFIVLIGRSTIGYADDNVIVDSNSQNAGTLAFALHFGPESSSRRVGEICHPNPRGGKPICEPTFEVVTGPSEEGIASTRVGAKNRLGLDFYTENQSRMSITQAGLVGIGTIAPTRTVEVHHKGDVEIGLQSEDQGGRLWTIQSSGIGTSTPELNATFQVIDRTAGKARIIVDSAGTVSVGVLKIMGGSDVAEPFPMTDTAMPGGSVVRIDEKNPGTLVLSNRAYDTRVAGIVSGANGIDPGLRLQGLSPGGRDVALSGRVFALADASQNPINPGDLLTTSDVPGHCMRATDEARSHGTIIGKAMTGLASGRGTVLVLVSLQ